MTPAIQNLSVPGHENSIPPRQPLASLLASFDELVKRSEHELCRSHGCFEHDGREYPLARYLFLGPEGGGDTIRIGIFATIHGDEEGALGLLRFLTMLDRNPELAQGYALYIYPVCNPTGYEDNTRHARSGKDLNREFWKEATDPEVRFLETEIWTHAFDGIITLHSDDTSDGLYGFVNGEVLSENLIEPALCSAEEYLPRNWQRIIDGFPARGGIIYECYQGVLKAVPGLDTPPFEITFETPQSAPAHLQAAACAAALRRIITEYRNVMAVGQNI